MIHSPFSPARLHELHWVNRQSLDQIAELANRLRTEDGLAADVDAPLVETWLRGAGEQVWTSRMHDRITSTIDNDRLGLPAGLRVRRCAECGRDWPLPVFPQDGEVCGNCVAVRGIRKPRKKSVAPEGMAQCCRCRQVVPLDQMRGPSYCIPCESAKRRAWYDANREYVLEKERQRKARLKAQDREAFLEKERQRKRRTRKPRPRPTQGIELPEGTGLCRFCHEVKALEEMVRDRPGRWGCKPCVRERSRAYYEANRERILSKKKEKKQ